MEELKKRCAGRIGCFAQMIIQGSLPDSNPRRGGGGALGAAGAAALSAGVHA